MVSYTIVAQLTAQNEEPSLSTGSSHFGRNYAFFIFLAYFKN